MGCWYKTCGMSNLHIEEGEPVYVFPLERAHSHERCYATAFWQPILLPYVSEYNDYGSGQNSEQFALNYILNALRKQLVEMEVGENEYHDIAVKRDGFNEEQFYDAVKEGRLKVKNIFGDEAEVDFVMMRKDIVDNILSQWQITVYQGFDKETNEGIYDSFGYAEIIKEIPKFVEELAKEDSMFLGIGGFRGYKGRLGRVLNGDDHRYSNIIGVPGLAAREAVGGNVANAERLLATYVKGLMVDMFFEETRRIWTPGAHEGSQNRDLDAYKILLNVTNQAIEKEEQEIEEW